jgi:MFS family permease
VKLRKIPRGTFWLGGLAGVGVCLPLTTLALVALAQRFHVGPQASGDAAEADVALFAAIFAGLPTFLAGGGVARLVAHRLAESKAPSSRRGLVIAAIAMGIAGIGAALLTAVPLGGLPENPRAWWPILVAGLVAGFVAGIAIGLLVAGRTIRHRRRLEAAP